MGERSDEGAGDHSLVALANAARLDLSNNRLEFLAPQAKRMFELGAMLRRLDLEAVDPAVAFSLKRGDL
jgi:Asp-tRNA(Asn)/Glu-tRNA(Gln) amidotransferase C subunit